MSNDYHSEPSINVDMSKFSNYVKANLYPNRVEGVGVSYKRHFRTIAEIQKEIVELKNLPLSQEEYFRRLKKLKEELEERKQTHSPPMFKK